MGKRNRKYFDDYDFEEAYNEQIEKLEQDQIEKKMKEEGGAAYQTKTTKAGDHLEADIYPVALVNKNWTLKLFFFTYNTRLLYSHICFFVLLWC